MGPVLKNVSPTNFSSNCYICKLNDSDKIGYVLECKFLIYLHIKLLRIIRSAITPPPPFRNILNAALLVILGQYRVKVPIPIMYHQRVPSILTRHFIYKFGP